MSLYEEQILYRNRPISAIDGSDFGAPIFRLWWGELSKASAAVGPYAFVKRVRVRRLPDSPWIYVRVKELQAIKKLKPIYRVTLY